MSTAVQTRTATTEVARIGLGVAFAMTVLIAAPAAASGPYVAVEAGPSFFVDPDLAGTFGVNSPTGQATFEPGFNVSGAGGYRIGDYLRAEGSVTYRLNDAKNMQIGTIGGLVSGKATGEVSLISGMANLYLDLYPDEAVSVYLGAGFGVGYVDFDVKNVGSGLSVNDESIEFAWQVLVGINVPVTKQVALTAGYRFFSTTDVDLDATLAGLGAGQVEAEVRHHELTFGLRYEF